MKRLALIIVSCMLVSCANLQQSRQRYQFVPAAKRQAVLARINQWRINAAVGIHTPQKSVMGNLSWRQEGKHFYALLSGPLGFGSARVAGSPGQFTLWKSSKKHYVASSPEKLMNEELGWSLPVSNMHYWIRSLPAPHVAAKTQFDQYGHLVYLAQQGWKIYYADFRSVKGADLPTLVKLKSINSQIKIVISHWSIG